MYQRTSFGKKAYLEVFKEHRKDLSSLEGKIRSQGAREISNQICGSFTGLHKKQEEEGT